MRPLTLLGAVSAGLLTATLAAAAPAPDASANDAMTRLAPALGNTIVSTHPDGRKARLRLAADGTYAAESRAGARSSGTWRLKGETLCLHQSRPLPIPFSYCKAVPAEQVGTPWRDTAVNGEPVTNEIVRGDAETR